MRDPMTPAMKAMVMGLFIGAGGAVVGFIGLIGDWYYPKMIGLVSIIVIGAFLWLSGELKAETLDRLLLGKTDKN